MTTNPLVGVVTVATLAVVIAASCVHAGEDKPDFDTSRLERLTGVRGGWNGSERVFKVSLPHPGLRVTVVGVRLSPPMGLTSWAAFKRTGGHTTLMGDLVLLEDQVNPVWSRPEWYFCIIGASVRHPISPGR